MIRYALLSSIMFLFFYRNQQSWKMQPVSSTSDFCNKKNVSTVRVLPLGPAHLPPTPLSPGAFGQVRGPQPGYPGPYPGQQNYGTQAPAPAAPAQKRLDPDAIPSPVSEGDIHTRTHTAPTLAPLSYFYSVHTVLLALVPYSPVLGMFLCFL